MFIAARANLQVTPTHYNSLKHTHVPDLCLTAVFGFVVLFRQVPSANSGATNQILAFPLCDHYISFT